MPKRRLVAGLLVLGLLGVQGITGVQAANPPAGTVTATPGGSSTLKYSGTVPPGAGAQGDCSTSTAKDTFELTVSGTGGTFYQNNDARLTVRIEWDPTTATATQDLALDVQKGGEQKGYSDGGSANETVIVLSPEPGQYQLITCDFAVAAPQDYKAQVSLTTTPKEAEILPPASDAKNLQFMPIVTVDPQRDVAEPSLRIDKDGNFYECGPFGASRAADYATKSEDNGDTFRVLGEPPEGRIAPGGGGDCELAVAPRRNAQGNYNVSYTGLEALLNFSTGKSADTGKTFTSQIFSQSVPLVDRQWMEAHGENEVYLFYNQIPFGGTLQRSTDGGLTYNFASNLGNAAPNIFRPGNLVIDHNTAHNPLMNQEIVYGAYTDENKVMVFRSYNQGQTFQRFQVVEAKGRPDNLFPSLAIDTTGNLYAAWTEKGSFNTYYSFSTDRGQTWAPKQLVNRRGVNTTVMPWIEAGSPGRVAVSFYCSPSDGDPEIGDSNGSEPGYPGFKGPWNVCMNQSLNALGTGADFSQVRVTHHPIHWDSICLSGLGCNVSGGDRTLLDFFQTRVDPRDGRVYTVFNESNKRPRRPGGPIAIVTLSKQKSGPSLYAGQGTVPADTRAIVRSSAADPAGDALFDFSSLNPTPPPRRNNVPAMDVSSLQLSATTVDGRKAINFRLDVGNLSTANMVDALAEMESSNLKYVIRWFSGYKPDYVIAQYRPDTDSFEFFEGNLSLERCEQTVDGKLEVYPAPGLTRARIPGSVNRSTGVINMKLPYAQIQHVDYYSSLFPPIESAQSGDQIFEVTAFTFGRPQAGEPTGEPGTGLCSAADYYNQGDSTPSFDHRLP
jgi:hypothetical protein